MNYLIDQPIAIIAVALLCGVSLLYALLSRSMKKRADEQVESDGAAAVQSD